MECELGWSARVLSCPYQACTCTVCSFSIGEAHHMTSVESAWEGCEYWEVWVFGGHQCNRLPASFSYFRAHDSLGDRDQACNVAVADTFQALVSFPRSQTQNSQTSHFSLFALTLAFAFPSSLPFSSSLPQPVFLGRKGLEVCWSSIAFFLHGYLNCPIM